MLLFSILYGIMLNSLIGLGAFPISHFLAGVDVIKRVKSKDECMPCEPKFDKGTKSRNRWFLSIVLFNILPFGYFAYVFQNINLIGDVTSTNIVFIGFLSLGVFAFPQFFFCVITSNIGNWFYTQYDLERIKNERAIHPCSLSHLVAGLTYFLIPLLLFLLLKALGL